MDSIAFGARHTLPHGLYRVVFVNRLNLDKPVSMEIKQPILERLEYPAGLEEAGAFADRRVANKLFKGDYFVLGAKLRGRLHAKVAELEKTIANTAFYKREFVKQAGIEGQVAESFPTDSPHDQHMRRTLEGLSIDPPSDLASICAEALTLRRYREKAGEGEIRIRPFRYGRFQIMEIRPPQRPGE